MRMGPDRLHGLFSPDTQVLRSVGPTGPFHRNIQKSKLHRVHSQLFGYLIYQALHGEHYVGGPGRTIGCGLGFVVHHVIPVHMKILYVVWSEYRRRGRLNGRPGEGPGLKGEVGLGRDDAPLLRHPHLYLAVAPAGGARGLENLRPAHGHLHRLSTFL